MALSKALSICLSMVLNFFSGEYKNKISHKLNA
jgi:hypothetical protein